AAPGAGGPPLEVERGGAATAAGGEGDGRSRHVRLSRAGELGGGATREAGAEDGGAHRSDVAGVAGLHAVQRDAGARFVGAHVAAGGAVVVPVLGADDPALVRRLAGAGPAAWGSGASRIERGAEREQGMGLGQAAVAGQGAELSVLADHVARDVAGHGARVAGVLDQVVARRRQRPDTI